MIGAVISMGAEGHSLTLGGHHWSLDDLDRGKRSALADMLSDAMGIQQKRTGHKPRRRHIRKDKGSK